MSLNISCLSSYSSIPYIPLFSNISNELIYAIRKLHKSSPIRTWSSSIAKLSFSSHDAELFFDVFVKRNQPVFDMPVLLKTKLILSTLIYTIITIGFFLTLSITFYIVSFRKFKNFKFNHVNIFLIVLMILNQCLLIQMIVIINDVHKTKQTLVKSLSEVNREIYPDLIKHLVHVIKQLKRLDKYSVKCNFLS